VDLAIIAAVQEDKPVSLRGVYYRAVSAGAVDKTRAGYELVSRELLKLRRCGAVPYADITDGTRGLNRTRTFDSVEDALTSTARAYRRALWANQDAEVMLFTEKDAITGVLEPVTLEWDVPLGVLRGYASESFCWTVAQYACGAPGDVYIYQLGDHDPSGLDAWRAFRERVRAFAAGERSRLHFSRLAVTPRQITAWGLPTRPTKRSDTRAAKFAGESVEVDAIRAGRLRQIVRDAIEQHIDQEQLRITREAERAERQILTRLARGARP
jgi:hypothetical protein